MGEFVCDGYAEGGGEVGEGYADKEVVAFCVAGEGYPEECPQEHGEMCCCCRVCFGRGLPSDFEEEQEAGDGTDGEESIAEGRVLPEGVEGVYEKDESREGEEASGECACGARVPGEKRRECEAEAADEEDAAITEAPEAVVGGNEFADGCEEGGGLIGGGEQCPGVVSHLV